MHEGRGRASFAHNMANSWLERLDYLDLCSVLLVVFKRVLFHNGGWSR